MKDKKIINREERQCIRLKDLIYEISDKSGMSKNDVITLTSLLISSIKEHLAEGDNINLGELGVLTHHTTNENRAYEIRYTPSLTLLNNLNEKRNKKTPLQYHQLSHKDLSRKPTNLLTNKTTTK